MTVGIPGTGLGGVLYILLCGWMAVREIWLVLALGGGLMSLVGMGVATGILAALVVSLRLLRLVVPRPSRPVLPLTTAGE